MKNNDGRKIAVIGSVGLPARYGGFETLVDHLQKNLGGRFDIHVFCSAKEYEEQVESYENASLHYVSLPANGAASIPYDIVSMIRASRFANLVLVLGVSGAIFLPILRAFSNVTIVTNIDGIEWRRDKWGKFASWLLRKSEALAVKYSDIVVADNKCISAYVRRTYGVTPECVAYGGDHVRKVAATRDHRSRFPFLKEDYAVKVCRIEPENNVHVVLEAFENQTRFQLVVIGNWQSSEYGRKLYSRYTDSETLALYDPIYKPDDLDCIRSNAVLYVHGHSAGGTNPSLVEAMSLKLPVLAFDVDYNRATTEGYAAYFNSAESLLRSLINLDTEGLAENRTKMSEIALRRYRWSVIADKYSRLLESN